MALADMVAGIQGAFAAMVALREAEREDGRGQVVDLSLLEPLHMTLGPDAAVHRLTGRSPLRSSNRVSLTAPRNVYATVDGAWLALSASTQGMAARLFRSLDRSELIEDPRFRTNADRLRNVEELDAIVQDFVGQHTLESNLAFFAAAQVTVGPVYDAAGFGGDPHVQARGVLVEMGDAELGSLPTHEVCPRFSHTPGALRRPAPDLGQHDEEVLVFPSSEDGRKCPQDLRVATCSSAAAASSPVEIVMDSADFEDTLLLHVTTEFMVCFARFVSDCEIFDGSEPDHEASLRVQDARPWEHSTVQRRWRHALKEAGKLVAHTKAGAYGKVRVLRCCLDHDLAVDEDVIVLLKSLILDLEKVLHGEPDCACQLLSTASSADC